MGAIFALMSEWATLPLSTPSSWKPVPYSVRQMAAWRASCWSGVVAVGPRFVMSQLIAAAFGTAFP